MKFNRFVTVNCLFAGNTRVSLRSRKVVSLFKFLVAKFFTAGKKRMVGTDKAVNCQGKSFSAASMVTKVISVVLRSASEVTVFPLGGKQKIEQ